MDGPSTTPFTFSGSYPSAVPVQTQGQSLPPVVPARAASNGQPAPYPPAIADAPSPTPESIVADTKQLPPNVRYAPSSAPHDAGPAKFDRSA